MRIVASLFIIVTVASLLPCVAAQGEKLGLLRIKAEYPVQVPRSYSFSIKLRIEYAFRDYFEFHAAVYEGARGALDRPLWEGVTERLVEVGEKTYDVQLKSPSTEEHWVLTGYVFFHNASGSFYFTDQERGPGFVEITIKIADNANLTLRAAHGNIPVLLDGSSYSTDASGILERELKILTEHSIEAPKNVTVAKGWRILFQSWNGTDSNNVKRFVITKDVLLTIDFRDEFYLDVVSELPEVKGAGWYASGAIANFSAPVLVPSKSWEGMFGVQLSFVGWSGDVESTAPNESIVMDRPHRVAANWAADYEPLLYPIILAAVLVAVGFAVFVRRRAAKGRAVEVAVSSVRSHCMFCGSSIDPDARFCSKCGRSQISSE
jgi:hypothetical protein